MREILKILIFIVGFYSFGLSSNAETAFAEAKDTFPVACETDYEVFTGGEVLHYIAYYKLGFVWFRIGEVIFTVEDDGSHYVLTATGRSFPKYSWVFPVNDYYKTTLSKSTLKPVSSLRVIREGNYRLYEKVNYDWVNDHAIVERGKTKEETQKKVVPVKSCARDLLSLPYFLRAQDYSELGYGDIIPFNLFLNEKNYGLAMVYQENVTKSISKVGDFDAQLYSAHTIAGTTFGEEGSVMNAYISNDQNKVPIFVESDIYVGSVKLILEDTENLKYPFTAKLNKR